MKCKIKTALREVYGDFNSILENQYEEKVVEILLSESWDSKIKWVTYNQLILELKNTIKNQLKVKELQYRLTNSEDPNIVCIDVLESVEVNSPELTRLYYKIKSFI